LVAEFQISKRMIAMTIDFKGLAAAVTLLTALSFPCYAEDATMAPAASDQAAQGDAKPRDVQRPALTAKSADTAPDATTDIAPSRHRHYAHRRYYRHVAYWEPFPIYFPHFFHNRITWNRVPWIRF
jgi:hypothetical protein